MPPCGDNKKRTVTRFFKEGKKVFSPLEIIRLLETWQREYSYNYRYLEKRDKALVSLLAISCCRINEALRVRKSQLDFSRLDFLLIRNFVVSKRRRDPTTRLLRFQVIKDLPLTLREGATLYPFTRYILEHAEEVGERSFLFEIGVRRARGIVTSLDVELFPHYVRASMLTYYLNLLKNPYNVAKMFGIVDVNTLRFYYGGEWEDYQEALSA